jgi:hypothetical protein
MKMLRPRSGRLEVAQRFSAGGSKERKWKARETGDRSVYESSVVRSGDSVENETARTQNASLKLQRHNTLHGHARMRLLLQITLRTV